MRFRNIVDWLFKAKEPKITTYKMSSLIPKELETFFYKIGDFGSFIQTLSKEKSADEAKSSFAEFALYRLHSEVFAIHLAVADICRIGWTRFAPLLLRAQLEITIYMALIAKADHSFRAFKYFYKDILAVGSKDADKAIALLDATDKKRAQDYIANKEYDKYRYWFQPEFNNIGEVRAEVENRFDDAKSVKTLYSALSLSTHVTHIGLSMFKDKPDEIDIAPSYNPKRTTLAICGSCRILLEASHIRNIYEELNADSVYKKLNDEFNKYGWGLMGKAGYSFEDLGNI